MKLPISIIKPINNFLCILTTTQCKRRCLITTRNATRIYLIVYLMYNLKGSWTQSFIVYLLQANKKFHWQAPLENAI